VTWKRPAIGWWTVIAIWTVQAASSIVDAMFLPLNELLAARDRPIETAIQLYEQTHGNTLLAAVETSLLMGMVVAYLLVYRRSFFGKSQTIVAAHGAAPAAAPS
jgi:hypothetical protein